ncbi:breast cancer anti-estrogen resistance protein 1 isoform X2 [Eupeodes corollae]|uniref:breast cancer anti-estrogen resistance protein 1 isoform X2 n=1 Tax=Eupeodes corollae TaxID=290404 RepID=UPI0024919211|nr:breast cancer anti-estrogen resistance protein 1 isoform X2 [Eupeodes corollae]
MIEKMNSFYTNTDYDVPAFTKRINKKIYAKAIYDNLADTPDELAFKKGDILTVIEQDSDGCEGWWLCTVRGRQGICPGNRLRIINSYDSGCFSPSPASSPCPSLGASTATLNSSISSSEIYENSSIISGCTQNQLSSLHHHHQQQQQQHQQQQQQFQQQHQHNIQHQLHQKSQSKRRSWHTTPHKVITPQRHGDVYVYNSVPSSAASSHTSSSSCSNSTYQNLSMMSSDSFETYDVPKPATPINYDCPKNWCRTPTKYFDQMSTTTTTPTSGMTKVHQHSMGNNASSLQEECYDVPKPINLLHQQNMTPSSSNSSLLTSDSLSLSFSSSNRSSLANMPDYDIPRKNPIAVRNGHHVNLNLQQQQQQHHMMQQQQQNTYDYPLPAAVAHAGGGGGNGICTSTTTTTPLQDKHSLSLSAASPIPAVTKELPLELSSALETLAKLQNEATTAISRLLYFVTQNWRNREKLEPVVMEVKLAAVRLRTALHDLTEFGEGALGNAARSEDRNLSLKLRPLVKALRDADKLIHESSQTLDNQGGWTTENLQRNDDRTNYPPDSLDQLIACAQTSIEDVRQTTSFIQGNAPLLFKRSLEIIETPTHENNNSDWLSDNDYVDLESKDAAAKKNSSLREAIPQNLQKKFDNVLKSAEEAAFAATDSRNNELNTNDKLLVRYYAAQITTHMGYLTQAIDSFLETVEKNQPPKFFIAYGKFVVLSAHNLVTIGDIVHRNISKPELKEKVLRCTDALSDALKTCVTKSKKAAQHFPSVTAVQEMVDSVVDISHLASALKISMLKAVQLTKT